ncbi:hypothetical protein QFZ31_001230 [Neobacillus niacini]|uniref:hypothetical protein n=1 Tax=Neobacillus driksii TaxID=3035913 RepID=UPI002787E9DE|nr:hypothetical protein [Neobacillus niacini]MDQ0971352.1 hypothetical protein [Neobacillus niacini]
MSRHIWVAENGKRFILPTKHHPINDIYKISMSHYTVSLHLVNSILCAYLHNYITGKKSDYKAMVKIYK